MSDAPVIRSPLEIVLTPGRHGVTAGPPGVTIVERRALGLATLTARKDLTARCSAIASEHFGTTLPEPGRRITTPRGAFAWIGPGQWMAEVTPMPTAGMEAFLSPFAGCAAVVDQSHARTVLHISGPRVDAALAKGMPIDLDASVFGTGHCASTLCQHIAVHIWRLDDGDGYGVSVARGFAASFAHWLIDAAAEFGLEVAPPA